MDSIDVLERQIAHWMEDVTARVIYRHRHLHADDLSGPSVTLITSVDEAFGISI